MENLTMSSIDLTPLYRSSIGYDRFASLLNRTLASENSAPGYPPYNIEMLEENHYAITLALAGFTESDLDINVERGVLNVRGEKTNTEERQYLHQGIANRTFERKFNLDDHVEVVDANMANGLLTISLVKVVPEAMKPKSIKINQNADAIEHAAAGNKAA
ncbi:MAG: molecular chaperone IbpA [Halieaceae bacterium]|jgi:molecular chaperone IbpA